MSVLTELALRVPSVLQTPTSAGITFAVSMHHTSIHIQHAFMCILYVYIATRASA